MLNSTAKLLMMIHIFFDEIGYQPSSKDFNFEDIIRHIINTVNHAKTLDDAILVFKLYHYYLKKCNKFIKKYFKYPEFWDGIQYKGRKEIEVVSDEEAIGVYYITNALSKDFNNLYISGYSFDNGFYAIDYVNGFYSIDENPKYYLRKSRMSSDKLVLTNSNKKVIATIAIDKDTNVYLENNKSRYELIAYESGVGFYESDYIYSLDNEEPDFNNHCKAYVFWDAIDDKGDFGLSRLDVYDENADFDLLIMLAASCFLVFKRHLAAEESRSLARMIMLSAIASRAIRIKRF